LKTVNVMSEHQTRRLQRIQRQIRRVVTAEDAMLFFRRLEKLPKETQARVALAILGDNLSLSLLEYAGSITIIAKP
jgi:hypothetical protein